MKCKSERLLPEYIEGTLRPEQVRQLELHLSNCFHCQRELEALEKTIRLAGNLSIEYPSPEIWEAFWPNLRAQIDQYHLREQEPIFLWMKTHKWKLGSVTCILISLLSLWGVFNGGLFRTDQIFALEKLISQGVIPRISVKQLQEQLNHELQSLEDPLVWGDEVPLVDEISAQKSVEPNNFVNQLFRTLTTEIDIEFLGDEGVTEPIPSKNGKLILTSLD